MRDPRSIVITGGSSGIGEALALLYAAPGVHLGLTGRDPERLGEVVGRCRARGAQVAAEVIDVRERDQLRSWLRDLDRLAPVDLVVANAGISAGTGGAGESDEQARRIFEVNVTGVLNTIQPLMPMMASRRRGQVALMSSIAAFRGFPTAPAYCASKAAVRSYGEALRGAVRRDGIEVSVICPGYVRSRMTALNDFPMPLLMDADRAARIIRRGLEHNRARIAFPWPTYAAAWLLGVLPPSWTDPLLERLPAKQAAG